MGQGWRFLHFWLCILLIATAIQGVTPDSKDLASPKLFRMISSMLGSEFGLQDGDDSVPDVYEPVRMDRGSRVHQPANKIPLRGPIAIGTFPEIFSPDVRPGASHRNDEPRPRGLIHSLSRLRC